MAQIQLQQITKSYDGHTLAVRALDLACGQGEMLALLGPSGCGKSSTLKMVAGIEPVTSGQILFDGVDVTHRSSAGRNVAMVFEDYALYPHMSVRENIAFPLRVRRLPAAHIGRKVDEAMAMLGLVDLAEATVRALSGGAQQRVSIGRALVREPALVMFDEPLSHLDADQKVVLRTEIRRMQSTQGLTSMLVTHDQTEAMAMADRIAVMDHGVLQQVGTPAALYHQPANRFVAGFIGDTPMNFIPARLDADGALACDGLLGAPLRPGRGMGRPGDVLVLGIRPEDIELSVAGHPVDAGRTTPTLALRLGATVIDHECGGDQDVLRLRAEAGILHAVVDAPTLAAAGEQVVCELPMKRLHYFSAEDGRALGTEGPAC